MPLDTPLPTNALAPIPGYRDPRFMEANEGARRQRPQVRRLRPHTTTGPPARSLDRRPRPRTTHGDSRLMTLAEHLFELRSYAEANPFHTASNERDALRLMNDMANRVTEFQRCLRIADREFGITITYQEDEKIAIYIVTLIRADDAGPVSDSIADHILSQAFDRATEQFRQMPVPPGVNCRPFILLKKKGAVHAIRN
jgi:hypothetical protein